MKTGVGHGFGKLILCGEHAVVYGHPALAVAVNQGATVRLRAVEGPTHVVSPSIDDPRLLEAVISIVGESGWAVTIESDLPIGKGMGSSAAIAVALVRAFAHSQGQSISLDDVYAKAYAAEAAFHGTPSGLDHAVASRGGMLWFERGPPTVMRPAPVPPFPVVVIDSGSAGNTKDMVNGVLSRRPAVDPILAAIGDLVPKVHAALLDPASLGPLLLENHGLLKDLGVSTPVLDQLVDLAMAHGAHGAKMAGAGGGGVVLAVTPSPEGLVEAANQAGFASFIAHAAPIQEPA